MVRSRESQRRRQSGLAKDIQPILQKTCIKCHGPEKQKGKLRLDSKEAAFQGGKDGQIIVPGSAAKSDLYRRITLPKGNEDIMPNEGEPLAKAQIDLIRDWLNQGAVWPDNATVKGSESSSTASARPADFKPSAAELKAITKLQSQEVAVRPVAMNVNWHEANFRLLGTNVTDAMLAPLKDCASLIELNLATTKITDAGLVNLAGLSNLATLNLSQTAITDAGLANLKKLTNLTYLNLYATSVTDAGLSHLKELKRLRQLYLWQTKATDAGVKSLKSALPNVDINTGWDLSTVIKKEDKPEPKEEKK